MVVISGFCHGGSRVTVSSRSTNNQTDLKIDSSVQTSSLNNSLKFDINRFFFVGFQLVVNFDPLTSPSPEKNLVIRMGEGLPLNGSCQIWRWQPAQQPAILSEAPIMRATQTTKLYPTDLLGLPDCSLSWK